MMRPISRTVFLVLTVVLAAVAGCQDTVDKAVVEPVKGVVGQQDRASLEAALANARALRQALLRHTVTSIGGVYPTSMDVAGYEGLRQALPDANFPAEMAELMWDPAAGLGYISDGLTFEVRVRTMTLKGESIVITPQGVAVE